ncbi:MAG: Lysyl-tRNA synthetase [Parcubacteria group bacterium GW2011_GWC2_39_14]|nr:MAG: Lysyl-tRNA synthetase [Parcubacteria group bacterium GW2011_GWC2_39_14]KKR53944.1 MAG: Lysyl-tRNA synthetase [Parcubacteria group bacterium GW2011_GWA2_40_23]
MNHIYHVDRNFKKLQIRFAILKLIREFLWQDKFIEIESPTIVALPGQEPNIQPMQVVVHDDKGKSFKGYLHTSPEYTMKKMLATGFEKIFYLGKCFRDEESFGGTHNPEFTMLEWYRQNASYYDLMDDLENLTKFINKKLKFNNKNIAKKWKRQTMKQVWQEFIAVNLDDYLDSKKMYKLCVSLGYKPAKTESYEELFYRIFLNKIEPFIGKDVPTIIYEFPKCMASLSKEIKGGKYAERFELYYQGIELANVYTELNDAEEQKKRLQLERKTRQKNKRLVYPIDEEFIDALRAGIGNCAGGALGVDRLVMIFTMDKNIDNVLGLPMSKLFNKEK